MAFYRRLGSIPPKRHTQHRRPDGELYYEELIGEEGFSSDSSLLYHRHIPSAIVDATPWHLNDQTTLPNHPLKPRHLRLHDLFPEDTRARTDVVTGADSSSGIWTCGSLTSSRPLIPRCTATPSETRSSTSNLAAHSWKRCSVRYRYGRVITSSFRVPPRTGG